MRELGDGIIPHDADIDAGSGGACDRADRRGGAGSARLQSVLGDNRSAADRSAISGSGAPKPAAGKPAPAWLTKPVPRGDEVFRDDESKYDE